MKKLLIALMITLPLAAQSQIKVFTLANRPASATIDCTSTLQPASRHRLGPAFSGPQGNVARTGRDPYHAVFTVKPARYVALQRPQFPFSQQQLVHAMFLPG